MELYQIRTFLAVAQEQNLTRAAERLSISQPAVSGQIKSLEQELGVTLFERHRDGMQLSAAGRALREPAQHLASAASALRARASALTREIKGRLKLGVVLHPDTIRLGPLTSRLASEFPAIFLEVRHRNTLTVVPSLRSHELDASFYIGRDIPSGLGYVELRPLVYRVAAAPQWADRLARADWATVARLPWIVTPQGAAFAQLVDSLFASRGLELTSVVEADQEQAIVSLVEAGVGISLIREELALEAMRGGRVVLWTDESVRCMLRMLYLKSREGEPLIRTLLGLLAAVWADRSPETMS